VIGYNRHRHSGVLRDLGFRGTVCGRCGVPFEAPDCEHARRPFLCPQCALAPPLVEIMHGAPRPEAALTLRGRSERRSSWPGRARGSGPADAVAVSALRNLASDTRVAAALPATRLRGGDVATPLAGPSPRAKVLPRNPP
jgi:hypothetical protein